MPPIVLSETSAEDIPDQGQNVEPESKIPSLILEL